MCMAHILRPTINVFESLNVTKYRPKSYIRNMCKLTHIPGRCMSDIHQRYWRNHCRDGHPDHMLERADEDVIITCHEKSVPFNKIKKEVLKRHEVHFCVYTWFKSVCVYGLRCHCGAFVWMRTVIWVKSMIAVVDYVYYVFASESTSKHIFSMHLQWCGLWARVCLNMYLSKTGSTLQAFCKGWHTVWWDNGWGCISPNYSATHRHN